MSARLAPPSTHAGSSEVETARSGFGTAAARFGPLVPALLASELCLRAWALWQGTPEAPTARLVGYALRDDLLLFARALPVLFVLSWPLLTLREARWRVLTLGAMGSLWLLAQIALEQYYLTARVPLGADLFGYSWQEVRTTASDGVRLDAPILFGQMMPLAVWWAVLVWLARRPACFHSGTMPIAAVVLAAAVGSWWLPLPPPLFASEATRDVARNKTAYFIADNLRYRHQDHAPPALVTVANPRATNVPPATHTEDTPTDPRYPFLHHERTPDVLGPHFAVNPARPPNLVFVVVEGLGRSFSGPDATLGSFTPFLDELGARSLYWSNFLANQGRTFAVLPSVFGSLPFGEHGFAALGERMPPHTGLLSTLKRQGYRLQFYGGFDAAFDNERTYLQSQGVEQVVDSAGFGPKYRRNPYSSWGYDDHELMARVLADSANDAKQPFAKIVQTMSMHTSFRFPRQAEYRRRFEHRLDELQVATVDKAGYRQFADIYSAVMFTDDALRGYFKAVARDPAYANTIFIITGDHRLPEIPMDTRIERYHVPLIVYSPLLKRPARIRSVSSHLDVAPSLLAFLARNYGLKRPQQVTWTSGGLDMEPTFRNVHDIPLKQTKTALSDFVSGSWYVSREQLYQLREGMRLEPSMDPAGAAQVAARFARYRQANERFVREGALVPDDAASPLVAYDAGNVRAPIAFVAASGVLNVREVHAPDEAKAGTIEVTALFANDATSATGTIVPLLVLSGSDGRQLSESYGAPIRLAPGATVQVRFALKAAALASGRYYLAVIPSHPDSGQRIGEGRYRIPLHIHG